MRYSLQCVAHRKSANFYELLRFLERYPASCLSKHASYLVVPIETTEQFCEDYGLVSQVMHHQPMNDWRNTGKDQRQTCQRQECAFSENSEFHRSLGCLNSSIAEAAPFLPDACVTPTQPRRAPRNPRTPAKLGGLA